MKDSSRVLGCIVGFGWAAFSGLATLCHFLAAADVSDASGEALLTLLAIYAAIVFGGGLLLACVVYYTARGIGVVLEKIMR